MDPWQRVVCHKTLRIVMLTACLIHPLTYLRRAKELWEPTREGSLVQPISSNMGCDVCLPALV